MNCQDQGQLAVRYIQRNSWWITSQLFAYDIPELTYIFAGQEVNEQG
jgi:hypothetical protein